MITDDTKELINKMIEKHKEELNDYMEECKKLILGGVDVNSDYYKHRSTMCYYHRGAINALQQLINEE